MIITRARQLGVTPLARIVSTGVSALSPEIMGLGPVEASWKALANAGMSIGDIDLVEINEAFAAQVIPCYRDLGIDPDRLNVHGRAIALGHPFGMTGARITTTLINALRTRDKRYAPLCSGRRPAHGTQSAYRFAVARSQRPAAEHCLAQRVTYDRCDSLDDQLTRE
jgi:acetyl-CoA acetyltransferase